MVQTCRERALIEDTLFPGPEVGWLYTDARKQGKNSSVGKLVSTGKNLKSGFQYPHPKLSACNPSAGKL